MHALIAKI